MHGRLHAGECTSCRLVDGLKRDLSTQPRFHAQMLVPVAVSKCTVGTHGRGESVQSELSGLIVIVSIGRSTGNVEKPWLHLLAVIDCKSSE